MTWRPASTPTWTRYWFGSSHGTAATAARNARSARPETRPGSRRTSSTALLEIHQTELALAPLDHDHVALGEAPVPLGREGEDAAHALVLADVLLEAGPDLAALAAVRAGDGLGHHADAVPRLAAVHVGLLAVAGPVARLVVEDGGLDRIAVGQLLGHRELERGEHQPLRRVARQLHVAVGHEAEAVHQHLLEPELLGVLEEHHARRGDRPAHDGLGVAAPDAGELGGEVVVAGAELLVDHVDAGGGGLGLQLIARAHPEGAGVVQHRHVLDAALLEEVEQPGHHLHVVDGGLEHPRPLLHRLHQGGGAGDAHQRDLGALHARHEREADVAAVAVAHDGLDAVLLDEALGRQHRLGGLAPRVVEGELDAPAVEPALLVGLLHEELHRALHAVAQEGGGAGVGEDRAELDRGALSPDRAGGEKAGGDRAAHGRGELPSREHEVSVPGPDAGAGVDVSAHTRSLWPRANRPRGRRKSRSRRSRKAATSLNSEPISPPPKASSRPSTRPPAMPPKVLPRPPVTAAAKPLSPSMVPAS